MASTENACTAKESKKHVYDACVKQRDVCQTFLDEDNKAGGRNVQLLQKALLSAELSISLLEMKNVDENKALIQSLQKHVESVLDSTYHQENVLVDKDFPQDTCIEEMKNILKQIDSFVQLIKTYFMLSLVLEKDIIECLHWRPGALMYMYCCTIMNDTDRIKRTDTKLFKECCRVGILHFLGMFQVHTPLAEGEEYTTNDENVVKQLQAGIRSDTHMLGLAYGGELCHWYNRLVKDQPPVEDGTAIEPMNSIPEFHQLMQSLCDVTSSPHSNDTDPPASSYFDAIEIGKGFVTKYISAAEGSIRLQSWNCDRPRQILKEFEETACDNNN